MFPQCRQCALGMRMLTTEATHCDAACQDASHLQRTQQLSEFRVHCPMLKMAYADGCAYQSLRSPSLGMQNGLACCP